SGLKAGSVQFLPAPRTYTLCGGYPPGTLCYFPEPGLPAAGRATSFAIKKPGRCRAFVFVLRSESAEYLPGQAGGSTCGVLADAGFLLGNHLEQTVQRLLGYIAFHAGALPVDHAEGRGLAGETVVLLGQTDPVGGLFDNGQEAAADLFAAAAVEVLRGGVL